MGEERGDNLHCGDLAVAVQGKSEAMLSLVSQRGSLESLVIKMLEEVYNSNDVKWDCGTGDEPDTKLESRLIC